jgi:hypothetical protein
VPQTEAFRPPLVSNLFGVTTYGFAEVLARYPLAKLAAADLGGIDSSLAIEQVIRERYRDSSHDLDQRLYRGILPYLQELLHTVSARFTDFPQNYEALVTNLLRLPDVVFISLNYDVILDRVLEAVDRPAGTGMSWYIQPDRRWSLIKLHGSVDWARRSGVNDSRLFIDPPQDLALDADVVRRPFKELYEIRGLSSASGGFTHGELHYPVLSVPIGRADELACPDDHVSFLRQKLASANGLHLLLIGYSGNDQEVIGLVREAGKSIASLTIVDRDESSASEVEARLVRDHGLAVGPVTHAQSGFNTWVQDGGLAKFINVMSGVPSGS